MPTFNFNATATASELNRNSGVSVAWTFQNNNVMRVNSTGIPFHGFGNPAAVVTPTTQNYSRVMPYRGGTTLPGEQQSVPLGPIGFWINGVAIVSPNAGTGRPANFPPAPKGYNYNSGFQSADYPTYSFYQDLAGGFASPSPQNTGGQYHYNEYSFATAWQTGAGAVTGSATSSGLPEVNLIPYLAGSMTHTNGHSKILGWALDGFPIYGPYGYADPTNPSSAIIRMNTGYGLKNPSYRRGAAADLFQFPMGIFVQDYMFVGGGSLDSHNGRFCKTPDFPDGTYAYFMTVDADDTPVFPYVLGTRYYGTAALQKDAITWITPAGSLGTIPEGIFYQVTVYADTLLEPDEDIYYIMIAGTLPEGVQCRKTGLIEGIPKAIASLQGVPAEVSRDVTSKFTVRAYIDKIINGVEVITAISDQTFTLTVTGQDIPDFVTPAGNIGTYYDGVEVSTQILFSDTDPGDRVRIRLLSGELPPGLVLDPITGLISGVILPLVGPPGTATAGYDATQYAEYPFDFSTRSASKNFQFTLEIADGKQSNTRTFEIYVYSKDSMSADTTDFTADNTFITADVVPTRSPVLLNTPGFIGTARADNFYAYKFDAIDFDGDPIEYQLTVGPGVGFDATGTGFDQDNIGFDRGTLSLPPGLAVNPDTGWFYGYIPDQGATEFTYRFAIRVAKKNNLSIVSDYYYFTITISGDVDTDVTWLTAPDLGTIDNGAISTFAVAAVNAGGRPLEYRLQSGSNSKLPQGLTLQPSGNIVGRVSFNTFALDNGTTTFDTELTTRLTTDPTTFDLEFNFTVNAYAAQTEQLGYEIQTFIITNGGSGYTGQPTVLITAPPNISDSIQATAGVATIVGGVITAIEVGNPGRGYQAPPTITITGGGGTGAIVEARMQESNLINAVSVFRRFTITVNRVFDEPYQTLYIQCMPPEQDRALISQLVLNQDIIPADLVYRADDPNFGVSQKIVYDHAYGLTPASLDLYIQSLDLNHYWKDLVLGEIKSAQALDSNGNVLYEVVYSQIIDNLVNNQGQSVGKQVTWPVPINLEDSTVIDVVYPNSLINMRNQVIDTVGQISPALPLWMTSKQQDGRVLGFTPAWVIAYIKPGQSERIIYNIVNNFGQDLNIIDFEVDRYELDRSQTHNWLNYDDSTVPGKWIPYPPEVTTFDNDTTYFDGRSVKFISPADRWIPTTAFDKYLVFPKRTILG
jgi:hypothetical protein